MAVRHHSNGLHLGLASSFAPAHASPERELVPPNYKFVAPKYDVLVKWGDKMNIKMLRNIFKLCFTSSTNPSNLGKTYQKSVPEGRIPLAMDIGDMYLVTKYGIVQKSGDWTPSKRDGRYTEILSAAEVHETLAQIQKMDDATLEMIDGSYFHELLQLTPQERREQVQNVRETQGNMGSSLRNTATALGLGALGLGGGVAVYGRRRGRTRDRSPSPPPLPSPLPPSPPPPRRKTYRSVFNFLAERDLLNHDNLSGFIAYLGDLGIETTISDENFGKLKTFWKNYEAG